MEETIAMIHVWIKRSGQLPLTLKLYVRLPSCDCQASSEALLNALINYTSRWEHVQLCFIRRIAIPQLGNMPCLRTFSVTDYGPEDVEFPVTSCPELAGIPCHLRCNIFSAPLPWAQLTHIDVGYSLSTREMFFVIRSCPKLIDLEIALYDDEHESPLRRHDMVISKSLQKLQLSAYETCDPLLRRLTLPALTDISIQFMDSPSTDGFQKELLRFLSRSKCKLDRLSFDDCGFDDVELLECLEHVSCTSLVNLRISNADNVPMLKDTVLIALTDMGSVERNVLLPKLARLSLDLCFGGSPGRLGTMILSRRITCHKENQVQCLFLHHEEFDERDIILIKLAENQGLEIEFSDIRSRSFNF
jgi:hypothetical protein